MGSRLKIAGLEIAAGRMAVLVTVLLTGLLTVLVAVPVQAQYLGSGTSAFAFMDLPVSSRLNALGGTNVSVRDGDLSMAMCNPALLGTMTDKVLQLNYAYYLPGTMFGSALYGHNFGRSKIEKQPEEPDKPNYFAVGLHFLDYGTMKYANSDGNLTGGTFGAKDILIDVMYARQLSPHFTVGVTLKRFSFSTGYYFYTGMDKDFLPVGNGTSAWVKTPVTAHGITLRIAYALF